MNESDINQAKLSVDVIDREIGSRISVTAVSTVLESVPSTNTWLIGNCRESLQGDVGLLLCATEQQTAGRGRRGKVWHSPINGVTFSLCFTLPVGLADIGGLTLLAGSAVCECLWQHGVTQAKIKWPNDILVNDAKLVGILVEVASHTVDSTTIVIGIGVNYQRGDELSRVDQASTDLFDLCGASLPERSLLIARLAVAVYQTCNSGPVSENIARLADNWSRYDSLAGLNVRLISGDLEATYGRANGIDPTGRLRIQTASGVSFTSSGEVSVRAT